MKTLAQYLAEYVEQEAVVMQPISGKMRALSIPGIYDIIEQRIDAYQSTENCEVLINPAIGG